MYENMSYEFILKRALDRVDSDIDKRQGSIIYDALAPCCMELSMLYTELDRIINEGFADTASREFLIKRASERGLKPYEATCSVVRGEFNIEIEIGTRFNLEEVNFYASKFIGTAGGLYIYELVCESSGEAGNIVGVLTPIENINGLGSAKITNILIYGEEEEPTEVFRKRYFESIENYSFGGNIADYKQKVMAIEGVGGVKVITATQSGEAGIVKLIVQGSDWEPISNVLKNNIKNIMDPAEGSAQGLGLAPIGHSVEVISADTNDVEFSALVTYKAGYEKAVVVQRATEELQKYIKELNANWAEVESIVIKRSRVWYILSELEGVENVENVKLDNKLSDLTLSTGELVGLGGLNV